MLDYSNSYQTFRHLFNLPVNGQRTWGGGNSIKITKSNLFNYKFTKLKKITNCSNNSFLAETTNIVWKYQWFHEWYKSRCYEENLPWFIKTKKRYIDLPSITARRVESFFPHPFKFKKKKHHRKKKIINKNVLTCGFMYGFSFYQKSNLF